MNWRVLHAAVLALPESYEKALVLALMEMCVEGVSTRKVKDITEALCDTSFSKSLFSSLAGCLDAELRVWRSRSPLARSKADAVLTERIERIHRDSRETYGAPRIHAELRVLGIRCARKRG